MMKNTKHLLHGWLKEESNKRGMHEFDTQHATILEEKTS